MITSLLVSDGDLVMGPIPGEAGTDYPVYNTVPDTGFDCAAQDNPGIYTDTEAGCQVWDMNNLTDQLKKEQKSSLKFIEFLYSELIFNFSLSTCAAPEVRLMPSFVLTEPSLTSSTLCVIGGKWNAM